MNNKTVPDEKEGLKLVAELCDHHEVSAASRHHLIPGVVKKLMQSWSTRLTRSK